MQHYTPPPHRRNSVSARTRRLIGTAWIVASLVLPAFGLAVMAGTTARAENLAQVQHTVSTGETLTGIALRYGVTVDEIVAANGLTNPDRIYEGQVLVIPREEVAETTGGQSYTIGKGDTLNKIARRYGTSVDEIATVNGLANPNVLEVGQQLIIPGTIMETVEELRTDTIYTMQRGDSLYRVSLIFGVPVDSILAANDLASPNAIYPGLPIRIPYGMSDAGLLVAEAAPEGASGGRTHVVAGGDTLASIALRYDVTVDGIIAANGLSSEDRLYAGQQLNVPESGAVARVAPAQTGTAHRVQIGETLGAIALRYGVTVQSLAIANGIGDPSRVVAGILLSIPSATTGSNSVVYASTGPGLCIEAEPERSGTGYFVRPSRGYTLTQRYSPWHPGVDLAADVDTPIYASDGGTVVYAGWNTAGYGNLIVLDHGNGWRTYYAHLNSLTVNCNEWIPRGSIIGYMGTTGNSTGPHLHFEVLRYGIAVNPEGYVRF